MEFRHIYEPNEHETYHVSYGGIGRLWTNLFVFSAASMVLCVVALFLIGQLVQAWVVTLFLAPFVIFDIVFGYRTISIAVNMFRRKLVITARHIVVRQKGGFAVLTHEEISSYYMRYDRLSLNKSQGYAIPLDSALCVLTLQGGNKLEVKFGSASRAEAIMTAIMDNASIADAIRNWEKRPKGTEYRRKFFAIATIAPAFILFFAMAGILVYSIFDIVADTTPSVNVTATTLEVGGEFPFVVKFGDIEEIEMRNDYYQYFLTDTQDNPVTTVQITKKEKLFEGKRTSSTQSERWYIFDKNQPFFVKIVIKNGDIYCFNMDNYDKTYEIYSHISFRVG